MSQSPRGKRSENAEARVQGGSKAGNVLRSFYIFQLPETVKSSFKHESAKNEQAFATSSPDYASTLSTTDSAMPGRLATYRCNSCQMTFIDLDTQKQHKQSEFHRLNLRRKLQGLPPLLETDAQDLAEFLSDAEGDDSTDEEPSSDDEESEQMNEVSLGLLREKPVQIFHNETHTIEVYNQVLGVSRRDDPSIIQSAFHRVVSTASPAWAVFLMRSGRFAAAIFVAGTLQDHKTFQRYTTRRKQGGAQSSKDGSGNAPNSAGASLRRYNEAALNDDIRALLSSWRPQLNNCSHIFLGVSKRNRTIFFSGLNAPLAKDDERIRYIPFATKRPTLDEVKKTFEKLATVRLKPIEIDLQPVGMDQPPSQIVPLEEETFKKKESGDHQGGAAGTKAELNEQELPKTPLYLAVEVGDAAAVTLLLEDGLFNPDERCGADGYTALHKASEDNNCKLIRLLLNAGASPEALDFRDRPPYFLCKNKETRDTFRRFCGENPERWNYSAAGISSGLTEEMEAARRAKARDKKKRAKAKKKEEKSAVVDEAIVEEENGKTQDEAPVTSSGYTGLQPRDFAKARSIKSSAKSSANPSPEEKRRLMLEAAMRRMGNS